MSRETREVVTDLSQVPDELLADTKKALKMEDKLLKFDHPRVNGVQKRDMYYITFPGMPTYVLKALAKHEYDITKLIHEKVKGICKDFIVDIKAIDKLEFNKRVGSTATPAVTYYLILLFYQQSFHRSSTGRFMETDKLEPFALLKRLMLFKMMFATVCLHEQGIVHSDLKHDNFFGDGVKLGDFGLASTFDGTKGSTYIGLETIPPELFDPRVRNVRGVGPEIDTWGLGMVMLQYYLPPLELSYPKLFGFDLSDGRYFQRTIPPGKVIEIVRTPDFVYRLKQRGLDEAGIRLLHSLLSLENYRKHTTLKDILVREVRDSDGFFYPLEGNPDYDAAVAHFIEIKGATGAQAGAPSGILKGKGAKKLAGSDKYAEFFNEKGAINLGIGEFSQRLKRRDFSKKQLDELLQRVETSTPIRDLDIYVNMVHDAYRNTPEMRQRREEEARERALEREVEDYAREMLAAAQGLIQPSGTGTLQIDPGPTPRSRFVLNPPPPDQSFTDTRGKQRTRPNKPKPPPRR